MIKQCKTCGLEKSLPEFSRHRTNKDGYNNKCKTCVNEYGKNHRMLNHEKELARAKYYYEKNKDKKKLYNDLNRKRIANKGKKYRIDNKKLISEKRKKHYLLNKCLKNY